MPTTARVLLLPSHLVGGAVVGVASVALHQLWWGLLLGIVAPGVTLVALTPGWGRLPFALGWIAVVGYLTVPRPEGDFVIGDGVAGYALIAAAMVFLVSGLVTIPRGRPDRGRTPT